MKQNNHQHQDNAMRAPFNDSIIPVSIQQEVLDCAWVCRGCQADLALESSRASSVIWRGAGRLARRVADPAGCPPVLHTHLSRSGRISCHRCCAPMSRNQSLRANCFANPWRVCRGCHIKGILMVVCCGFGPTSDHDSRIGWSCAWPPLFAITPILVSRFVHFMVGVQTCRRP
jgi:hypothetical protein